MYTCGWMPIYLHVLAFVSTQPLPGPFCPTGYCSDGGSAGWFHILLSSWKSHAFSWRRSELHPPPGHRTVSGLPGQIPWGSHHLPVFLRTTGEPWEATPRCEYAKSCRHLFQEYWLLVMRGLSCGSLNINPCLPKCWCLMSSHQGRGHLWTAGLSSTILPHVILVPWWSFFFVLGLWSPVTSALVRMQVADVLISSVTVPQGQRYDSQRSHSESTNHVCAGMYQSVCLLYRVRIGGSSTFLILISHSSNHQWWRMSIPGTQEEGAGSERQGGRERKGGRRDQVGFSPISVGCP